MGLLLLAALAQAGCAVLATDSRLGLTAEEHNDLGIAYYSRDEYSRAARHFEMALRLRPDLTLARVNLGSAHLASGNVSAAIAAYEAARRALPDDPTIANNLAYALLQDPQRWPEAEPVLEVALASERGPRGHALDTLGMLRLRAGDPAGAAQAFRDALRGRDLTGELRAVVMQRLAEALLRLGDRSGARRCLEAARGLDRLQVRSGTAPGGTGGITVGPRAPAGC